MGELALKDVVENTKKYKTTAIVSSLIMVAVIIINIIVGISIDLKFIAVPIIGIAVSVFVGISALSSLSELKYQGVDFNELEWILSNEKNLKMRTFVGDEVTVYTINADHMQTSASKADPTIYKSIKVQTPRGIVWASDPSLVKDVINYRYEARIEYNTEQGIITKMCVSRFAQ